MRPFRRLIFKLKAKILLCKTSTVKETCVYTAHEISSKNLFKVGFWGAPPSPLQLRHQHNSPSSVCSHWLERCKLQAHAQQKQSFGGKLDLHSCLPAAGDVSHANAELLSRFQRLPLQSVKQTVHISEQKVMAKIDQTTVMSNSTPLHLHSPSLHPQTLFFLH